MAALYRSYRPQQFDDVVGQSSVVRTLRNAITADNVAHAYLFSGSRGTGKTTMAKLLAKALNCVNGPTVDPCGTCESCVSIADGRSIDVAEIDAASNNGVQDVREKIIDTVAFRPAVGTRRVYILDEAHMLSTSAFNALLKTIEEPPPHVLFIFCTTETHKMMATVRDRCQRLTFAPPKPDELVSVLAKVAAREGIETDEEAIRAIARVSQGSFRNALGTLELVSTAYEKKFGLADVLTHLGVFSEELLFEAADAVLAGDAGGILRVTERLTQEGSDLVQFAYSMAEHLRGVLLASQGVESSTLVISDTARLAQQAAGADLQRILSAIDCLNDAVARIRLGSDARLAVETALVRACQGLGLPSLALRLAMLEHQVGGSVGQPLPAMTHQAPAAAAPATSAAAAPAPTPAAPAPTPTPVAATNSAPTNGSTAATRAQETTIAAPPAAGAPATSAPPAATIAPVGDASDVNEWWPRVVHAAASDQSLHAPLKSAVPVSFDGKHLVLESQMAMIITGKKREVLLEMLEQVVGRKVGLEVRPPSPGSTSPPAATGGTQGAVAQGAASATPGSTPAASTGSDDAGSPALERAGGDLPRDAVTMVKDRFDATELAGS